MTGTASNIVALFESALIRAAGGAQNINTIINTLRGSAGKDVLPYKEQLGRIFGAERKVARPTVMTVFGTFLAHGILRGLPVTNYGEPQWSTSL